MADEYDFQIDGLKFRAAISDQFPYSRSTAPFRKEQFDASATVGDQSLTGWWTRGQFSFHKGQGIKFYEILDGEGVLNRFHDATGIMPWVPGRVELAPDGSGADYSWNLPSTSDVNWMEDVVHSSLGLYIIANTDNSPASLVYFSDNDGTVTQVVTTTTGKSAGALMARHAGPVYVSVGSKIETCSPGATTSTVLWNIDDTPSSGISVPYIRKMFWAKERIWACNGDGRWYTLDAMGGTVPSGGGTYAFWDAPETRVGTPAWGFSFAESSGAVFFARGQYIWATTVAEDGTIASPYQVADLGLGVEIKGIAVNRGRLGIVTRTDFRVAEIMGEDGSLIVGPAYIQFGASTNYGMASSGDYVYFVATHLDDRDVSAPMYNQGTIFQVKIGDDVAELEPAWCIHDRGRLPNGGGDYIISPTTQWGEDIAYIVFDGTGAVAYGGTNLTAFSTRFDTGYLTTGQHRMGTLEKKQFYSVTVTVESAPLDANQKIDVYLVDKDGNETPLTVGVRDGVAVTNARDGQTTFDLSWTDPTESIGFKFKLFRGSAFAEYTPALLGYQVKALPVPQRQRILKWPLSIQDTNKLRRGTTTGKPGRAYSDLEALEALESSQAIVTFTDHRTGETGQAYIDGVEFQSDTPSSATTNGFGGVAYVTLRVLS